MSTVSNSRVITTHETGLPINVELWVDIYRVNEDPWMHVFYHVHELQHSRGRVRVSYVGS